MKYNLPVILLVLLVLTLAPIGYPLANNIHITKATTPTMITSLPYTITTPGVYVLSSNLSTSGDGILVESDDVVIIGNGFTITGSGVGGGINVSGHVNVTITNITLRNFWAGINVSNLDGIGNFTGIIIDNVRIEDCWEGILIWYVYEPGGVIINNTLINGSLYYGIDAYEVTDLYILNTVINGSLYDDYGIYLDSSEGVYIYNTTITNTYYAGIYVDSYYDYGYNTVTIVRSTIADTYDYGIEIYDGEGVLILYSNISNNYYSGVSIEDSSYVWLYQNIIENNEEYGVYVYYSYNVYINSSVIRNNSYSGIYLDSGAEDVSIWGNQIIYNDDYGVEADTSYDFNVTMNTFGGNSMHPQAYDENGVGNWTGNYWSDLNGSTYDFSYNQDPAPLSDPLPFIWIQDISAPANATYGSVVDVNVTVTNLGYGQAVNSLINLYWSEPIHFTRTNYTWIDVDPFMADNVSDGDIVEDFGNYTLWDEDDGYVIYKLPWPINFYGESYSYISVSTNGFVELLCNATAVIESMYEVHWLGTHRTGYDYISNYTYGAGVSTVFGIDGDLYAINWVGVFNTGDSIVVVFNGSTYEDEDPDYPIQYQIIFKNDGTIIITLGNITYTQLNGDGYTGLYIQALGLEVPVGFLVDPFTSWSINTALHPAGNTTVSLAPNETKTITIEWDTSTLPHLSPFTLWITGTPTIWTPTPTQGPVINVRPPPPGPAVVGGELTTTTNTPLILLTLLIIPITTIILIKTKK